MPSTETFVFALISILLIGGRFAELALCLARDKHVDKAANSHRLIALASLLGLALLILTFLYFWFCDPASDTFRQWLSIRGPQDV